MSAPERMHVGIYRSCDNTVAYQNVPVHRTDIDRSDGRLVDSVIYVRADLHDTLRAENERLRAALAPFFEASEGLNEAVQDGLGIWAREIQPGRMVSILAGDLRRVRAALSEATS